MYTVVLLSIQADTAVKILNGLKIYEQELLVKLGKKDQAIVTDCMANKSVRFCSICLSYALCDQ